MSGWLKKNQKYLWGDVFVAGFIIWLLYVTAELIRPGVVLSFFNLYIFSFVLVVVGIYLVIRPDKNEEIKFFWWALVLVSPLVGGIIIKADSLAPLGYIFLALTILGLVSWVLFYFKDE